MAKEERALWPYGTRAALLAAPAIWLVLLGILVFLRSSKGWSEAGSSNLLIAALIAGLVPLALCIVDYVVGARAVLKIKGVEIDFSQAHSVRSVIQLPDNIGRPEPAIADSSPMQIVSVLETATAHQVVRLDLRDGNAWWVTRLLALCAGAVRVGSPKVIVFVGAKEDVETAFLGWSLTSKLLNALIDDLRGHGPSNVTYGQVYRKAVFLARQLALFAAPDVPSPPPPLFGTLSGPLPVPSPEVQRYLNHQDYRTLGEAALEQIVMDLCAQYELEKPQAEQISALLNGDTCYVALVRNGRYEALLERAAVERQVLQQLLTTARP